LRRPIARASFIVPDVASVTNVNTKADTAIMAASSSIGASAIWILPDRNGPLWQKVPGLRGGMRHLLAGLLVGRHAIAIFA
jgi:hypothetical protein